MASPDTRGGLADHMAVREGMVTGLLAHWQDVGVHHGPSCEGDERRAAETALDYLNAAIEPGMRVFLTRFDAVLGELAEARQALIHRDAG